MTGFVLLIKMRRRYFFRGKILIRKIIYYNIDLSLSFWKKARLYKYIETDIFFLFMTIYRPRESVTSGLRGSIRLPGCDFRHFLRFLPLDRSETHTASQSSVRSNLTLRSTADCHPGNASRTRTTSDPRLPGISGGARCLGLFGAREGGCGRGVRLRLGGLGFGDPRLNGYHANLPWSRHRSTNRTWGRRSARRMGSIPRRSRTMTYIWRAASTRPILDGRSWPSWPRSPRSCRPRCERAH